MAFSPQSMTMMAIPENVPVISGKNMIILCPGIFHDFGMENLGVSVAPSEKHCRFPARSPIIDSSRL